MMELIVAQSGFDALSNWSSRSRVARMSSHPTCVSAGSGVTGLVASGMSPLASLRVKVVWVVVVMNL